MLKNALTAENNIVTAKLNMSMFNSEVTTFKTSLQPATNRIGIAIKN